MPVRDAVASDVPIIRALQSLLPEPVDDLFEAGLPPGITLVAVPDSARTGPAVTGAADRELPGDGAPVDGGGHPVGYVHAYDTGYVAELAVAPTHRGRGYGRALLVRALARLHARGVKTAELEVAADNDRARSLYESLGFTVVERRPDRYASGEGLRMRVSLDDRST